MSIYSSFCSLSPSRTKEPEIAAAGSTAASAQRRISAICATPASQPRKDTHTMIRKVMEVIHKSVGGLDVHKKMVMACRRRLVDEAHAELETRRFKTTTAGLRQLANWLAEWNATHVAMESTGIYWVPIWNILREQFNLILVNAHELKKVPGRKDDVLDAEWIAQCMQCGLLRASFVPSVEIRQWRHLTRQRAKLTDHHTAEVNRMHGLLHQANIKLSDVASNIVGVTCRKILIAVSKGISDPETLAALGTGRLKASPEDLAESLDGRVEDHDRWLLRRLMQQLKILEKEIAIYDERIRVKMKENEHQIELLDTITGIGRRLAENLLAEIGPNMDQFPTDDDLVSWAGLCPGRNESAGKKRSSKTKNGNKWVRRALVEAAWAAVRSKNTYIAALYKRLAPRRGKNRAVIAVARTILQSAWHMLSKNTEYKELGGNYFDNLNRDKTRNYFVKRLQHLGYHVELKERDTAA
jgi:transposase